MNTQDPAQSADLSPADERVQPDGPLSGEVKRGGDDPLTDLEAASAFTKQHQHRGLSYQQPFNPDLKHRNGKFSCWDSGPYQRWGPTRCGVSAKTTLADGSHWCRVHEPAAYAKRAGIQAARQEENERRYQASRARDAEKRRLEAAHPLLLAALREIAAGHNDPRTRAIEALAEAGEDQ